jgi:serine/threonine protein kinase
MSEFNPEPSQKIEIAGQTYKIMPHPMVPKFAFGQEGRKAFVYQLEATKTGRLYALKQFKSAYRHPELVNVCDALRQFSNMQGLEVCIRECFSKDAHAGLLATYPDLTYAVLMPWINGSTWYDIVIGVKPLSREESLNYAAETARVLAALEEKSLAHCDVSAPNVIINTLQGTAHLVDVEDLYAPGFRSPRSLPAGSEGYAHANASEGLWSDDADRFATAVLLAEMLAWHVPEIRQAADEEHYFGVGEMQRDGERYRLMRSVLYDVSNEIGQLFEQAWFSPSLAKCPPLALWHKELHRLTLPNPVKEWRPIMPGATGSKPEPDTPPEEPIAPPEPEPLIAEQEPEPMDVPPPPEPLPTIPIQLSPAPVQPPAAQTTQPPDGLPPAPPYSPVVGYRPLDLPPGLSFDPTNGHERDKGADDEGEQASQSDTAPELAQVEEPTPFWMTARQDQQRLRPPRLSVATGAGDANRPTLVWTPIPGATYYVIQESNQPDFPSGRQVTIRDDTRWQSGPRPPGTYYYRVRAHKEGGRTPWSNAIRVDVSPD